MFVFNLFLFYGTIPVEYKLIYTLIYYIINYTHFKCNDWLNIFLISKFFILFFLNSVNIQNK